MSLADKLASKLKYNKLSHGTSRLIVRDSYRYAASTMIGFIYKKAIGIRFFSGRCRSLPSSRGSRALYLGRNLRKPSKNIFSIAFFTSALSLCLMDNTYATSSSITITLDDNIVDLNVAPTTNGAFSKSSASKIGVSTTNYTGYTLSISAQDKDNPTALVNGDKSLLSIENALTEEQFKALDSTAYNNMWGYLPSKYNSTSNTSFLPSPSTNGDILDITNTANTIDGSTGKLVVNEYEITLGARVDTTASLGSYSNVFLVEAVANAIPYTITYLDDIVDNMPVDISDSTTDTTATISSNTPTRNGYTFIGWCTVKPTNNTNGTDTCPNSGVQVSAGGTITLNQTGTNNNFTLHAMWGGNYTIDALVASGATMQDLGKMSFENQTKVASTMVTDTNYVLKDSRDNQSYTISKLKDGQVWMTTNLNLAGGTEINSGNSDVNTNYTLPKSSINGFSDYATAYVYNSGNTTDCGGIGRSASCYSYYSYLAATAGSGFSVSNQAQDAPWSICPKGWRLPTSGNSLIIDANDIASYKRGDFYRLATAYGVNLENANSSGTTTFYYSLGPGTNANFLLAGFYRDLQFYDGGSRGYYWSSTSLDSSSARYLSFYTSGVFSANNGNRKHGFSIRCILK